MSVYTHPNKPGWQMIKIFRGKNKPNYIPFEGSREMALIFERELRGIADTSDPEFTDKMPEFKIAYKNEVMASTFKDFEWALLKLEPFFTPFKIRQITPFLIEQYKALRLESVGKRTINRELSYLSKYLQYCKSDLKPVKFRKKDCQPPPPQVMTMKEMQLLIDNLQPPVKHLVQLMAYNGLRRNEAFNIKSVDADSDGKHVRVWGKGGKWRTAPIGLPELQKAIAAAKKLRPDGYLFPNERTGEPYKDIRKSLRPAAVKAGIEGHVYNHLCRHSFATALVTEENNLTVIQNLMGHSDIKMTQQYIHLADTAMGRATDKLAAHATAVPDSVASSVPAESAKPAKAQILKWRRFPVRITKLGV